MDHTSNISIIEKISKVAPTWALTLSVILAFSTLASRFSISDYKGNDNAAQIEALKTQSNLQQRQIDQDAALEVQLKALAEQNRMTQQEVHDLSLNLQSFESRFIVIPNHR